MKVVAYCRVSTEEEEQLNSLESQKKFFEEYIKKNPDWTFVKLYVDEGISGTNTNKRSDFKLMIEEARQRKFDLILTKEVSRFARNTLDSLNYTRQLKSYGIGVVFLNDNINTLEEDSELRLTIMASMAQEESRKTSNRVIWGMKRKMEFGFVLGNCVYGYHLNNGVLTINTIEAEIVKEIFKLYMSGYGTHRIAKYLENKGIKSPSGLQTWKKNSIMRILKNEKYSGMLKQRKYITTDYLSHKKKLNCGEEEYIVINNHHEAIIDTETFETVQRMIEDRSSKYQDKERFSQMYAFSCKMECGLCSSKMYRRHWNMSSNTYNIVWQCTNNIKYGKKKNSPDGREVGCNARAIHESFLKDAFLSALDTAIENKEEIYKELLETITLSIQGVEDHTEEIEKIHNEIERIERKRLKLIELYTEGDINKKQLRESNNQYDRQIETFQVKLSELEGETYRKADLNKRLDDLTHTLDGLVNCTDFSDEVCKSILQKVIVYSRDKICFFLTLSETPEFIIPFMVTPEAQPVQRVRRERPARPGRRVCAARQVRRAQPGPKARRVCRVPSANKAPSARKARRDSPAQPARRGLLVLRARPARRVSRARRVRQARSARLAQPDRVV